jgi:small GTP-binding protein
MSFRGKALMLGSPSVGKTSLLSVYVDGKFSPSYSQTIGANFYIKEVDLTHVIDKIKLDSELKKKIRKNGIKIYLWDVGGQSDKLFVTEYYFVQAIGAILVFDITLKKTFDDLDFWISKLKDLSGDVPFLILGNKIDLENSRVISFDQGKKSRRIWG